MPNKSLNTRIKNKSDTAANWALATNFIPMEGEVIIYEPDSSTPYARVKVGDGVTPVTELLFTTPTFSINSSGELIATYSS